MKTFLCILLWVTLVAHAPAADGVNVPFYVQLIRGTDAAKSEQKSWRPVGPKLSKQFGPKFRWKHYWEVSRHSLSALPGKATRIRLSPDREIEIELRGTTEYDLRLYTRGKLARCERQKQQSRMSIMGGGLEAMESWFVVVRRDPPSVE